MSTYRIAIIGPTDVISGFRAFGVDTFPAERGGELVEVLGRIRRESVDGGETGTYAVVIAIESLVGEVSRDEWERATRGVLPAVVILPGIEGSTGQGLRTLRKLAERAVGSDILQ